MIVAHIAGVPVEETLQPVIIAVMLTGACLTTRLRRPRRAPVLQQERDGSHRPRRRP